MLSVQRQEEGVACRVKDAFAGELELGKSDAKIGRAGFELWREQLHS